MDGQGLRMCRFTRDGIPELGEYLESVDGIMRKEDGPIRHKENGAVRFRYPCRESSRTRRRLSEGCQRRFSRSRTVGHGGVGRSVADPRARTTTGVWIGGCEWARRRAGRRILVVVATPEV